MNSINDLIWDPNPDQNEENSEKSDSPIAVTPDYIAIMCCGGCSGGGGGVTITHAYWGS